MNNHPFGPTKCGDILEERVSGNKAVARKVKAFYIESMTILHSLLSIPNIRTRRILRDAYLARRYYQFIKDVNLDGLDALLRDDIRQRMAYLLKHDSRYLLE